MLERRRINSQTNIDMYKRADAVALYRIEVGA